MNKISKRRQRFRRLRDERPARYEEITTKECPDAHGLPSCKDTNTCTESTCEQCWKEALGHDFT